MTSFGIPTDPLVRDHVAELKALVNRHADKPDPDTLEPGEFVEDNLIFSVDPDGKYTVAVSSPDDYETASGEQRTGATSMYLGFLSTLEVTQAGIAAKGERGGGFERSIGEAQLGGFVSTLMVAVQDELSATHAA